MTEYDRQTGTIWVKTGDGSSVAELLDAAGDECATPSENYVKTDLLLTRRALEDCDRRRIAVAVRVARKKDVK